MRVNSRDKLPEYQILGNVLRIHFDYIEVPETEDRDAGWTCEEAVTSKFAGRAEIIEAIIKTKYPTYGSELAAISNGGDDALAHETMRSLAKVLADRYLGS